MKTACIPPDIEQAIETLPAIAPISERLKLIKKMGESKDDLLATVRMDPVLTSKVLRLVNSAFYGLSEPVRSLEQALALLGAKTVQNLTLSTAVTGAMSFSYYGLRLTAETFWRHCLAVALGCQILADKKKVLAELDEFDFMAGLLHDIGKIVFIHAKPDLYKVVLTQSREWGVSLAFVEQAYFGCSHDMVGGLLARKWKFDPAVAQALALHHNPDAMGSSKLLALLVLVNTLCKRWALGDSGNPVKEEKADDLARDLGVGDDLIQETRSQLEQEMKKAMTFLQVQTEAASTTDAESDAPPTREASA